jgi:hypothetical protein
MGISAKPRGIGAGCTFGNVIPPAGPRPDVNRGSEGEDWKCLSAVGLEIEGVGGTGFLMVEFAGVIMVRLILPIFRRGGVGGFTNRGEDGADFCFSCSGLRGAVEMARPRL